MKRNCYITGILSVVLFVSHGCQAPGKSASSTPGIPAITSAGEETVADPLHPRVNVRTSLGRFVVTLDAEKAPAAVLHFVQYIEKEFYDGTIFHRIPESPAIIQGGGYSSKLVQKNARYSTAFPGRWSTELPNRRGTLAMLRGQGPAGTGTAEFFINAADNFVLDQDNNGGRFAVLGTVTEGMMTVDRIRAVPVGTNPQYAGGQSRVVPLTPVIIESVRMLSPLDYDKARAHAEELQRIPSDPVAELIAKLESESGSKAVTTDTGLIYVDFRKGGGPKPLISDRVEFHYHGTFLNNAVFESTRDRDPFVRPVSGLNIGMMEGLLSMNEGGRRVMICPPQLAYGTAGIPGIIPPGATLIYDLELLSIVGPENP